MKFDPEKIHQLETLLRGKSFQELTPNERTLVMEIVESASEYDTLRKVEELLPEWYCSATEHLEPSPDTLPFLEGKLTTENPGVTKASPGLIRSLFNYQVSLSAAVAAWIIFGLLFWWLGDKEPQIVEKKVFVQLPAKVDTLYIDTASDTIYLEKVIYRDISPTLDIHSFNAVSEIDELAKIELLAVRSGLPISADSVLQKLIVTDN